MKNISEQNTNDLLTVILPIKDNHKMTKRWLKYAYDNKFKYKIYIADGGKKTFKIDQIFKKELDINYRYYGYDDTHYKYILKIMKSVNSVKTKYCLLADNDDFYIKDTINKSISYLEKNLKYSSCGGDILKFVLTNKIKGKVTYTAHAKQNSYLNNSSKSRMIKLSQNFNEIYYDVTRTKLMKKYTSDFIKFNKNYFNYFFFPLAMSFFLVSKGKVKKFDDIMLLRQEDYQSSTSSGLISTANIFYDTNFSLNFNNSIEIIYVNLNKIIKKEFIRDLVKTTISNLVSSNIISNKNINITFLNFLKTKISKSGLFFILKKIKYNFNVKKLEYSQRKLINKLLDRVD